MNNRRGFTIIELLVVIVVIGILATLSIVGYANLQKQSRDSQRAASAVVVAESLEKYYSQNGEYPNVAGVTASNANTVKQLLGITNINSLIAPNAAPGSTTNVWKSGTASVTNKLTYTANTDTNSACLTAPTGICTDFKIQYYKEETGTVETIVSRNTAVAPPANPAPDAPGATTVTVALSGSNALATSTAATCSGNSIPEYAYRSRTNDGTWSSYSAWGAAKTASTPASQGMKYGFQFKAHCIDGSLTSADSPISNEGTYVRPISAPTATALTNSTSGNNTTWSWPAVSCPAGTTAYYAINRGNDYDTTGNIGWQGWTADQTSLTWVRDTTSQGYNYTSVMRARCGSAYTTSGWSAESNYSSYLRPVSAPGGAYNWSYAILNSRTIYRWAWAEPACGQGTARSWQWDGYVGDVNNANGWNMYWLDKGPYYHYWYGASAPSFQDPGWYTGNILDLEFRGASTPGGIDVYARIKYRCQNPQTLRTAEGGWTQSPQNWT
jgi:prepilin-type N-terminal cleavage/methylation domain-containing protein